MIGFPPNKTFGNPARRQTGPINEAPPVEPKRVIIRHPTKIEKDGASTNGRHEPSADLDRHLETLL
ncbi:MAG: hypothetical protein ABSC06_20785 [Rhodopila sp.]|jgi:hypothetical protein